MQVNAPGVATFPTTDRLVLTVPQRGDFAELHQLYADPQVWRDDPAPIGTGTRGPARHDRKLLSHATRRRNPG
jgi:hypothetical protein